jgi:hypothetical protein
MMWGLCSVRRAEFFSAGEENIGLYSVSKSKGKQQQRIFE